MKRLNITSVRDLHFGRHVGRTFDGIEAPFIVVHGANESGKSTLAEFLVWAVGGPWRSAAQYSEIFRPGNADHAHGRLLADLDGASVDIDARFKILAKGTPNDARTGTIGGRQVDVAAIATMFGSLDAADYQLIYRLYGGSLGDIGSGTDFSGLFSSFAMGSATATVNPRQAVVSLRQKLATETTSRKKAAATRNRIEAEIKSAKKAPEEIAKIEAEMADVETRIDELGRRRAELAAERTLIERVRSGLSHLESRQRALSDVESLGELTEQWRQVAESIDSLERAADLVASTGRDASSALLAAETAVARCGLPIEALQGHSFTPPDRQRIQSTVDRALAARSDESQCRARVAELESRVAELRHEETKSREALSLSDADAEHLDLIAGDLGGLRIRADRWLEQANLAVTAESRLAAEQARLDSMVEHGAPGNIATSRKALGSPLLIGGVAVTALLALVHPVASVAAAVVSIVVALVLRGDRSSTETVPSGVAEAQRSVETAAGQLADARTGAQRHRGLLVDGVGPLGRVFDNPDSASARITALEYIASTRSTLATSIAALDEAGAHADAARRAVVETESAAASELGSRSIPLSYVNEQFGEWLALYETAIAAVAARDTADSAASRAREAMLELLAPVASEIADIDPAAVMGRVRDAASLLMKIRSAEDDLRQADLAVSAAKMNDADVVALLEGHPTDLELAAKGGSVDAEIESVERDRDLYVARRTELKGEIDRRTGVEILPGLHLQHGQVEEEIEELDHRIAALTEAETVLSDVIERYEREHQDPVVKTASELIGRVSPGWGTILFSRDDKGAPLLERVDSDGRLLDKFISDGGRALMYLALRIAFAKKDAEKRGVALPLICDDPLVHFDDERAAAAIGLLAETSAEHQVVLFTCEQSTRDIAASHGARVLEI